MRDDRPVSEQRQALMDAKNASPLQVGEQLAVYESAVYKYGKADSEKSCTCTIVSLDGGIVVYVGGKRDRRDNSTLHTITPADIAARDLFDVGANPFDTSMNDIRPVAFSFDSIMFNLDVMGTDSTREKYKIGEVLIKRANWNPYVYLADGTKKFYQRPLVWTLEDKQNLVESIYQNIDCGKILIRKRSFKELEAMGAKGETELAFNDIVDGKQRLDAVRGFIAGEYKDLHGNYFADLSYMSQHKFTGHQLFSYAEMPENTPDDAVLRQFLKLNFAGVPQSTEHIEYIRSLIK